MMDREKKLIDAQAQEAVYGFCSVHRGEPWLQGDELEQAATQEIQEAQAYLKEHNMVQLSDAEAAWYRAEWLATSRNMKEYGSETCQP